MKLISNFLFILAVFAIVPGGNDVGIAFRDAIITHRYLADIAIINPFEITLAELTLLHFLFVGVSIVLRP